MTETCTVPLHHLAHARAGDKGNRLNVSVIAYDDALWPVILTEVTEKRVAEALAHRHPSKVTRYVLPKVQALNFVIDDVLEGGVNASLGLDTHGKGLAFRVLELSVQVPAQLLSKTRMSVKLKIKEG